MAEDHERLIRRWVEAFNANERGPMSEMLGPSPVLRLMQAHDHYGERQGHDTILDYIDQAHSFTEDGISQEIVHLFSDERGRVIVVLEARFSVGEDQHENFHAMLFDVEDGKIAAMEYFAEDHERTFGQGLLAQQ